MQFTPTNWHRHPAVRSGDQLTRGERSADILRNGMGLTKEIHEPVVGRG